MGRQSGGIRGNGSSRTRDYYAESKRLRAEALSIADTLKGNPQRFTITNGITMDVEITKSDIKTIVSKNVSGDNKFNAIKNAMAKDIQGYIRKAKYEGWRETLDGKHPETAYFVYYNRRLGANTYLCVRRLKNGRYKPYAIIDKHTYDNEIGGVHKGEPPL